MAGSADAPGEIVWRGRDGVAAGEDRADHGAPGPCAGTGRLGRRGLSRDRARRQPARRKRALGPWSLRVAGRGEVVRRKAPNRRPDPGRQRPAIQSRRPRAVLANLPGL